MKKTTQLNLNTIGVGKPHVGIVGCLHGDEIIGKKAINILKKIRTKSGTITFIVPDSKAIKKKKRFIEKDLNRVFPGKKNGIAEERIAYQIAKILPKFDLVIDIHSTSASFDKLAIVTRLDRRTKNLLVRTPIKKVALIRPQVFGKHSLINYCKTGVSLEYGFGKSGRNYKDAVNDILVILKNFRILKGKVRLNQNKTLYTVFGTYAIKNKFVPLNKLGEFKKLKRGM